MDAGSRSTRRTRRQLARRDLAARRIARARCGSAPLIAASIASHGDTVDHFDRTNGLSGNFVVAITEDREGNIWVATSHGLDRFSDTPVVSFSSTEGLCSDRGRVGAGDARWQRLDWRRWRAQPAARRHGLVPASGPRPAGLAGDLAVRGSCWPSVGRPRRRPLDLRTRALPPGHRPDGRPIGLVTSDRRGRRRTALDRRERTTADPDADRGP